MPASFSDNDKQLSFMQFCSLVSADKPALVTRVSLGSEATVTEFALRKRSGDNSLLFNREFKKHIEQLSELAGILITNNDSLDVFVDSNIEAYLNSHAVFIWEGNIGKHFEFCLHYLQQRKSDIPLLTAHSLEPYYFFNVPNYRNINPYRNKTILVIASHIDSIKSQIQSENYLKCFAPYNIFENCQFKFVRPPQTLAGNHGNKDWQLNLPDFIRDIKDAGYFDLALVSCGGYGTPVTDYIYKKFNKTSIYIGGPLQLFFGVMGNRWRDNETIMRYCRGNTKYWINPLTSDTPRNAHSVEGACYW